MSKQQLTARLYKVACSSLIEANRHNPFITQSAAMKDITSQETGNCRSN